MLTRKTSFKCRLSTTSSPSPHSSNPHLTSPLALLLLRISETSHGAEARTSYSLLKVMKAALKAEMKKLLKATLKSSLEAA